MAPAALLSTVSALDASAESAVIFRRARPRTARLHVLATMAQTALFWAFFLFLVPTALHHVEQQLHLPGFAFPLQRSVAVASFTLLSALGLASGVTMAAVGVGTPLPFASPNRLVVSGPYAYVRNPMVIAGLGQGAAVGVWLGSWTVLGYVVLGGVIWNLLVRPSEERDLIATFGHPFDHYRSQVPCWLPRRSRFTPQSGDDTSPGVVAPPPA